jgi:hypothetical protein
MKNKLRKHGETFLTRPRVEEKSELVADISMFVWGYNKEKDCYTLSLLGVINGLLRKIGLIMYCDIDTETKEIIKWHIGRNKW